MFWFLKRWVITAFALPLLVAFAGQDTAVETYETILGEPAKSFYYLAEMSFLCTFVFIAVEGVAGPKISGWIHCWIDAAFKRIKGA